MPWPCIAVLPEANVGMAQQLHVEVLQLTMHKQVKHSASQLLNKSDWQPPKIKYQDQPNNMATHKPAANLLVFGDRILLL